MRQLLIAVQKELDTSQARLLRFVLKPPLDVWLRFRHRRLFWCDVVRDGLGEVRDFSRHLVASDSIAAWPALECPKLASEASQPMHFFC